MPIDTKTFTGATVLDPMRGAYYVRVAGLDFASLYPSIMIAHNLCFSTIVLDEEYMNLPGVAYETLEWYEPTILDENGRPTYCKFTFVQDPNNAYEQLPKSENPTHGDIFKRGPKITSGLDPEKCYQGILPAILMDLKIGRTNTKKLMKELVELDPANKETVQYKGYNSRQLAQKITMNSVYGFTGATKGMMPCKPISACVTSRGRDMIIVTKNTAEERFRCTALYGDSIPSSEYVYINYKEQKQDQEQEQEQGYENLSIKDIAYTKKSENSVSAMSSASAAKEQATKEQVQVQKTKIKVSEIEKYTGVSWTPYKPYIPFLGTKGPSPEGLVENKEQLNLEKLNYTTLSGSGPTKIQRVIRHKTTKKLYQITAVDSEGRSRKVIVTEDHSLITNDNKLMEANKLKVGTLLKAI